jgi:hypothetical protein
VTGWPTVRWTEAGQLAPSLGVKRLPADEATLSPAEYVALLRRTGRRPQAVHALAAALPRFEAVAWAVRAVRDLAEAQEPDEEREAALRAALLWLQDPSDGRRRAARAAADALNDGSAEYMAAMAVFYSGGSIAPEGAEPIPVAKDAAGRFAAAAVMMAATRADRMNDAIDRALDWGERVAEGGETRA